MVVKQSRTQQGDEAENSDLLKLISGMQPLYHTGDNAWSLPKPEQKDALDTLRILKASIDLLSNYLAP
jgi:hypothetical protein